MSQEISDPEVFADFIVEAKEHLETIEPNLLELEKNPGDLELLNGIFRPMHSLKGASGFLGLNNINSLAHKSESVMDELRKGNMRATSEIMDVILAASDALRSMIDNLEAEGREGDVDTAPIIGRLEALLAGETPGESPGVPPGVPPAETSSDSPSVPPGVPPVDAAPYALTVAAKGHLDDFLEEAGEIVEALNSSLVELEKDPAKGDELVNDIFRYVHNLKGNSGIIGFTELNTLTHEAETLLNRVRKGKMECSHGVIDLMLAVVDAVETLVAGIDKDKIEATPQDTGALVQRLRAAVADGVVQEPSQEPEASEPESAPASEVPADSKEAAPGMDPEDVAIFKQTVGQQMDNLFLALEELAKDVGQKDYIDALHRSLVTVQNSSGYMGLNDLKVHAERTAGLVDTARNSDMDFGLMLDMLKQECGILSEMVEKGISALDEALSGEVSAEAVPETAPEPAPEPPVSEPAPEAAIPDAPPEKSVETVEIVKEEAPAPDAVARAAAQKAKRAEAGAQPPPKRPKTSSTIRVDHEKLDHLMNLIGELIINRNRFSMLARHMEEGQDVDLAETAKNLTDTTYAMARISDNLQDTIMNVRMVPVQTVFTKFPRLVRDLSRKSGKKVELITEGEDTELDKSVVEVIGDPLVHLIRNSMDHGLESGEERVAAGKSETGRVYLRAYHRGNSVVIEVEDDGKGIDPQKMREVGVKKGTVTTDEAKALDDQEAVELIFAPGFSSAEKVTDISGRGVGMDVVRTNIKNLKGSVGVQSEVGKGSKFILSLPLTLAIIDALMVTVSGQTYAIPLDAVSETTKIGAERLTEVNNRKAVTLRGEVLGLVELSELLGWPGNGSEREILPTVVIQVAKRRLGLVVDTMLERQEIVIKPLGEYLGDKEGISGATIMGDGSVVLILDPNEVYQMATSRAV